MTIRYVDLVNGNNSWDGLAPDFVTGTNGPKLSLNGVEDSPVVAGDTIHVRSGVYRELLTCDVSGTAGNPITYVADVSGAIWGVGGPVRVTGSDNDQATARASVITATARNYRTFRGFRFDFASAVLVTCLSNCTNWIIEDCVFTDHANVAISFNGTGGAHIVRRCLFVGISGFFSCVLFTHSSTVDNADNLVEDCLMVMGTSGRGLTIARVGGITVRSCTMLGGASAARVTVAITVGQTVIINNCLLLNGDACLAGTVSGEIVEDYNTLFGNTTARTNTATGANSKTYPALLAMPMLLAGFRYPWQFGDLSQWSQVRTLAGTSMSADDFYGMVRPVTDSKKSWGSVQFIDISRETTTKRTGAASLKLADAGRHQMFVPVTAVSTTISCYVQWEADYTGTKPSFTIKQPGQSDITVTATGSSGSWELLTHTFTPAALPGYVVLELVSSNTAAATNFDIFVDDILVA